MIGNKTPNADAMIGLPLVTEGLLMILLGATIFAAIFLVYAAYLYFKQDRKDGAKPDFISHLRNGAAFVALIILVPTAAIYAAERWGVGSANVVLAVGIVLSSTFYFRVSRDLWPDDRIRFGALFLAIFAIFIFMMLAFAEWLYSKGGGISAQAIDASSLSSYINMIAQVAGILVAAMMIVITNRQNARQSDDTTRQQIYQALEIESVNLFRFEIAHKDLTQLLWNDSDNAVETYLAADEITKFNLKEYVCQILNLFEMATRFRRQGIIDFEIFGSWVIWMWELCGSKTFQKMWPTVEGIEFNYIEEFRALINAGLHFHKTAPATETDLPNPDPCTSFFTYVAAHTTIPDDPPNAQERLMKWLATKTDDAEKFSPYWREK